MGEFHVIGKRAAFVNRINVAETARAGSRPGEIGNGLQGRFPERESACRPIDLRVRDIERAFHSWNDLIESENPQGRDDQNPRGGQRAQNAADACGRLVAKHRRNDDRQAYRGNPAARKRQNPREGDHGQRQAEQGRFRLLPEICRSTRSEIRSMFFSARAAIELCSHQTSGPNPSARKWAK